MSDASYNKIPILNVLLNAGVYFFLLIFLLGFVIARKTWNLLLPLLLLVGLLVTIVLSPVILFRYTFPWISCTPILVAMLLDRGVHNKSNILSAKNEDECHE
jgi:CHASE2 domain-containing sensor protein